MVVVITRKTLLTFEPLRSFLVHDFIKVESKARFH